jgi:hypothetical protein
LNESGFVFTDEQFGHRGSGTSDIDSDGAPPAFQVPLVEDNSVMIPASLPADAIWACSKKDRRGRATALSGEVLRVTHVQPADTSPTSGTQCPAMALRSTS